FGDRFWKKIASDAHSIAPRLKTSGPLLALHYSDRYLLSPLSVRLIFEILRSAPGLNPGTEVKLDTLGSSEAQGLPRMLPHNWSRDQDRRAVMHDLLATRLACQSTLRFG